MAPILLAAVVVQATADEARTADTVVYAGEALLVPGEPAVEDVALFIRDGRVVDVVSPAPPAGNAAVVDLRCCFVLPGLIDTQTHLQSELGMPPSAVRLATWTDADAVLRGMVHARRTLDAGFTTVRDMGSHGDAMFALRDAVDAGLVAGPRMQVAGEIVRPTGGELRGWFRRDVEAVLDSSAVCDGPDDCRRAVRAQVARGADTIKVETKMDLVPGSPSQFSREELDAIVDAAQRLGVRVTASAFSEESINLPLEAGFDAVVHGTFADDATMELLESGAYFIPTLVAARTVKEIAEDSASPVSEAWRRENLAIHDGMIESFQRVHRAGHRIAFGTDAGWRPHGGNAEQLVQMVELGMTAAEAIASATVNAADAIGWSDDVGSLESGKFADLVATENSPLADIGELRRPVLVMKGGETAFRRGDEAVSSEPGAATVIHAGRVLVEAGRTPLAHRTIIVADGRIDSVHEGFRSADSLGLGNARVIDLSTQFVMAGLFDAHVHLTTEARPGGTERALHDTDADLALVAAVNAERLARAGFTSVMDMGDGSRTHEKAVFAVRDAIAAGLVPGPEIRAAGSPISAAGASRSERFVDHIQAVLGPEGVCSGADGCRDAVREQIARGADFINFYNTGSLLSDPSPAQTLTEAEMRAIVETAHAHGRTAVADGGNTPGNAAGIDTAIRAGADIIDTVTYPGPKTFRLLKAADGYFAPHVYALVAAVGDSRETLTQGSMGWLPEPILQFLFHLKQETPSAIAGYEAGANLVLAADSGVFPHGLNARELVEYVKLGIAPADALAAATVNAAAAHRMLHRTGTIESGKEADLVAFDASPLEDMGTVIAPSFVMSDGRILREPR